jgi:hypothetical protein
MEACPASHMGSMSWIIVELTDEISDHGRDSSGFTNQRILLPEPAMEIKKTKP